MTHLMNTYGRQPIAFTHGRGVWLFDEQGQRYLDAIAGIAVNTLGHAHPALVRAIAEQAATLIHTSNLYRVPLQERAADLLAEISGLDEVFFCNSGCEANEAAIKLARLYGHQRGIESPRVVVMDNAFHGRTLATLSATGSSKAQAGFAPLVPGFVRVPFNDLDAVRDSADDDPEIVAVMVEPIQGEGGINVSRLDYLYGLHELCQEREWLFIADEVQCGLGRTGKWFVTQHAGFAPDVLSLAKGLASGVPAGACLAGGRARGVFKPGNHGSTFGGNPLAMAAVTTTIETIVKDGLLANAERIGTLLREELTRALATAQSVRQVRGLGLMIGIELDRPCSELTAIAREQGLLLNVTHENVVRLLPALVMNEAEARELLARLVPILRAF
jgi:acetylornithine aminotransferase